MKFLIAAIAVVLAGVAIVAFVSHAHEAGHQRQLATGPKITEGDVTRAMRR